jgi:hypothetical protein
MKKFLICLLVVAIALLGFTGCPSPTTEDSGVSGPEDSVDEVLPELSELRALTKTALGNVANFDTLTPDRVNTIFTIVDEIETASYGWRAQDEDFSTAFPGSAGRAAENWENYDYYDEQNSVDGFVHKATNYPVYEAFYNEDILNWSRYLPDGDLAPGDTLDRTYIYHQSYEWPEVILKSINISTPSPLIKNDINVVLDSGAILHQSPYYETTVTIPTVVTTGNPGGVSPISPIQRDVVIDGKSIVLADYTYTNKYTKISERNTGSFSHVDTYFNRDYDYSYTVGKVYSIDTGMDYDHINYPDAPGAFKIKYELIVKSVNNVDLMITDDDYPIYPVELPAIITSNEFTQSIGGIVNDQPVELTINLEIRGKRRTATAPFIETDDVELLKLTISTWDDLIKASRDGKFARRNGLATGIYTANPTGTGVSAPAVDDRVITWVLKHINNILPVTNILPGAAVNDEGDNVIYESYSVLPKAVKDAIEVKYP